MAEFRVKRIYEEASSRDGYRVLVDRLWPRGVSKERAALDEWAKEIAPTNELRRWYGHDPAKFDEFATRYIEEIEHNQDASEIMKKWHEQNIVTLLYGARDEQGNEAVVLQKYLTA